MSKIITVTINRTVQFDVKYNGDSPQEGYEEIKQAFENNINQFNNVFEEAPYKVRYQVDNLDKVVVYDSECEIVEESDAPIEWKGR